MLADDEFHARQADPVVRPHRRLEGKIGIAEIDHDLRARPADRRQVDGRDLERNGAGIDVAGIALDAGHGDHGAALEQVRRIARADDGGNAELARDDGGVAGATAAVGDDGGGLLHDRFPVRTGRLGDQHVAGLERREILGIGDDAHGAARRSFSPTARPASRTGPLPFSADRSRRRPRSCATPRSRVAPAR